MPICKFQPIALKGVLTTARLSECIQQATCYSQQTTILNAIVTCYQRRRLAGSDVVVCSCPCEPPAGAPFLPSSSLCT